MALALAALGLPPATPPAPPKDIALGEGERAKYVGDYELTRPDGSKQPVKVFEENGQLMVQPQGQRPARLMHQGGDVFIAQGAGRFAFDVVNGRVVGFVTGGGSRTLEAVRK
jgi:hypothetical protein